jgi:nickel-dependent lactate racemase
MKTILAPWGMWYNTNKFAFTFPDSWEVMAAHMKGGPDIGDAGIRRAMAEPIGAPRLRDFAKGRRDAAILIDDLTRPTPCYRTVPYILEELAAAGLGDDKVKIVCAVASHRAMIRPDFIKKIGVDLLDRLEVICHNAYDNLEFYGNSSQGIPIWVNREFARADLKIAAGMITPRGNFFGGGAKLLLPGACGRETIALNHTHVADNIFRQHIDEVAHIIGLSYIVNPLLNEEGEIMAMVTGDVSKAYDYGVEIGRDLYGTEIPEGMDIVVCNAWPKDTEATQMGMGRVPIMGTRRQVLKEGGTMVVASACPEGLGFHSVMGPGTRFREAGRTRSAQRPSERRPMRQLIFSPGINKYDAQALFPDAPFFKTWEEVRAELERLHGSTAKVCVFPCGAIQHARS